MIVRMFEAPPAIISSAVPAAFTIARSEEPASLSIQRNCAASGDDIVVCGRRDESRYRLQDPPRPPLDPARDPQIPFGVTLPSGGRLGPTVSQVQMPGGFISQRVMMTLRIGF